MRCRSVQGCANPAYLEGFPFPALLRVAPYCVPGGIRVVSRGPGLSGVSGSVGPGLCRFSDTNIREHTLLGTWVNKGYLRGPGPLREERPLSCFLPTAGKATGPDFLHGSSSVSSPVRSHVAALPATLSSSSGASIIVTAVLNSTSVARRPLYILCFPHLGGT
jgi:hypothetical protein